MMHSPHLNYSSTVTICNNNLRQKPESSIDEHIKRKKDDKHHGHKSHDGKQGSDKKEKKKHREHDSD